MSTLDKFIGIPFVNHGRDLTGCDCWGLARLVWREITGKELPDYVISCMDTLRISEQIDNDLPKWERVSGEPPVPSIVLIKFDFEHPGRCNHIGVYVGNGMFIHTRRFTGSCKERIDSLHWKSRIEGFYIPKG
jgi:cell wall-associated NlpC family hydrolase